MDPPAGEGGRADCTRSVLARCWLASRGGEGDAPTIATASASTNPPASLRLLKSELPSPFKFPPFFFSTTFGALLAPPSSASSVTSGAAISEYHPSVLAIARSTARVVTPPCAEICRSDLGWSFDWRMWTLGELAGVDELARAREGVAVLIRGNMVMGRRTALREVQTMESRILFDYFWGSDDDDDDGLAGVQEDSLSHRRRRREPNTTR